MSEFSFGYPAISFEEKGVIAGGGELDSYIHIRRMGFNVSVLVVDEDFGLDVVVLAPDFEDVSVRVEVGGDREVHGTSVPL